MVLFLPLAKYRMNACDVEGKLSGEKPSNVTIC